MVSQENTENPESPKNPKNPESPEGARLFSLPFSLPFLPCLCDYLLDIERKDPLVLMSAVIYMPTLRSARGLLSLLAGRSLGGAAFMPRVLALGALEGEDIEEAGNLAADLHHISQPLEGSFSPLPELLSPLARSLSLARLIVEKGRVRGQSLSCARAVILAEDLGRLFDRLAAQGVAAKGMAARVATLIPEDYADHWREVVTFLNLICDHWPRIEQERGVMSASWRNQELLRRHGESLRRADSSNLVMVAGSTGSHPLVVEIMKAVLARPRGVVVVQAPPEPERCAQAQAHPLDHDHALAQLFAHLKGITCTRLPRVAVPETWCVQRLEAAAAALHGRRAPEALSQDRDDCSGLDEIACAHPGEEARVIGAIMRACHVQAGLRVALITADRALARRVRYELARWQVEVTDSAGRSLDEMPAGHLLSLSLAVMTRRWAPAALIDLLRHPALAAFLTDQSSGAREDPLASVALLEIAYRQAFAPAPGFAALRARLETVRLKPDDRLRLLALMRRLEWAFAPFLSHSWGDARPLGDHVAAHLLCLERLATLSAVELEGQKEALELLSELKAEALPLTLRDYALLLERALAQAKTFPPWDSQARVHILGRLEARLLTNEVMILGGLNEGSWPRPAQNNFWLARHMEAELGLWPPERALGLSARDFLEGLSAKRVFLTWARRDIRGQPQEESRWLRLLKAGGVVSADDDGASSVYASLHRQDELSAATALRYFNGKDWRHLVKTLDDGDGQSAADGDLPVSAAASVRDGGSGDDSLAAPAVALRPRSLSVTDVILWFFDPYGFYARRILGLRPLDALGRRPEARDFGSEMHRFLERLLAAWGGRLCAGGLGGQFVDVCAQALAQTGDDFEKRGVPPGVGRLWLARLRRIAQAVALWQEQSDPVERSYCELELGMEIPGCDGFKVTARVDRLDLLASGTVRIFDYKTGELPTQKEISWGCAPQLTLAAAMVEKGRVQKAGEGDLLSAQARKVEAALYWRLSGTGYEAQMPRAIGSSKVTLQDCIARTENIVRARIALYDQQEKAYACDALEDAFWQEQLGAQAAWMRERQRKKALRSDYAHLARVWLGADAPMQQLFDDEATE